jgi:hypothetical protein
MKKFWSRLFEYLNNFFIVRDVGPSRHKKSLNLLLVKSLMWDMPMLQIFF